MEQFLMITMTSNMLVFFIVLWIWRKHHKIRKTQTITPIKTKKVLAWTKVILIILLTNFISYLIVFMIFFMTTGG